MAETMSAVAFWTIERLFSQSGEDSIPRPGKNEKANVRFLREAKALL